MKSCLACGCKFESDKWGCPLCGQGPQRHGGFMSFAPELAAANDGFDPHFFGELARLEARNFWFEARNQLIIWATRRFFPTARTFLEIGCGTGFVLTGLAQALPELTLYGSEIFSEGLAFAQERVGKATLVQMDGRHIPWECEFDAVGAFDVLEHIDEDERVLGQAFKCVRPGGGVILTVPQHRFLWSAFDEHACHKRRYSRDELVGKVAQAGFEVLHANSFCSVLLPLMLLSRLRRRRLDDDYDPVSELKVNRVVNGVFRHLLDAERALIRAGVRFPWGGSLLVVASKPEV